jgi:putative ABC transport system ATP-binding protein
MEPSIFKFIYAHSRKQQLFITILTLLSFPFLYYSLELPKTIINRAIQGTEFPQTALGFQFDQIEYLLFLSAIFLVLVLINGAFKYYINVYKGRLGERLLRRLRYQLYERMLHFPLRFFSRVPPGQVIPIITSEVEPLGGFVGECFATPIFQGGTLLTILFFMAMQDPILGLAAIALYPAQAFLIPRLQRRVNQLSKERIRLVRTLADRIGETALGLEEIQAHAATKYLLAKFSAQLATNYDIRFRIYVLKFLVKFLNNFFAQLTPFFFYAIGGYFVITQRLTAGALVAILAAYKDLAAPWRELLDFYQQKEDARIKYEQVVEQFSPAGIRAEDDAATDTPIEIGEEPTLVVEALTIADEDGYVYVDGVSLGVEQGERIAVLGPEGSGKSELALALSGLLIPKSGRVLLGGKDLFGLPRQLAAQHIGYVGPSTKFFSASIFDNLVLGLRDRPAPPSDDSSAPGRRLDVREALLTGNSTDDPEADWIDYRRAGAETPAELTRTIRSVLEISDLVADLRELGLRGTIDPDRNPDMVDIVLRARATLRQHSVDPSFRAVFEPIDAERFNDQLSVGENLLFGLPIGSAFDLDHLAENAYVRQILAERQLTGRMVELGAAVARAMLDLFGDMAPGNELFRKYSFIAGEEFSTLEAALGRGSKPAKPQSSESDQRLFMSLVFRMIPAQHRLGLIDDSLRSDIVEARRLFAAKLPEDLAQAIEFFDPGRFHRHASLQDNILFGRLAPGQSQPTSRARKIIIELLEQAGIRQRVLQACIEVGLEFQVGVGGTRLPPAMHQKLAIARALLKRPSVLILNDAGSQLDAATFSRIIEQIIERSQCRTIVCLMHPQGPTHHFTRVVEIEAGRIREPEAMEARPDDGVAADDRRVG